MKNCRSLLCRVLVTLMLVWTTSCLAAQGKDGKLTVIKPGDNYQVLAGTRPDPKAPLKGHVLLSIEAKPGWKMNEKAPIVIDIAENQALGLAKTRLNKKSAVEDTTKAARFEIPYTASQKGEQELKFKFDFVVCTDELCQKKRFELTHRFQAS